MNNSSKLLQYSKKLSILIVEDHDEIRENSVEMLSNFFQKVDSAENGERGLELYTQFYQENGDSYDIVLTDLKMPKLDGVGLIKEIYKLNNLQKVIVLSAHDESQYLLDLINMRIDKFIKKPINFKELTEVLMHYAKEISELKKEKRVIVLKDGFSYRVDINSLEKDGENIYLTKYEIVFVNMLIQNIGQTYSNKEIVKHYEKFGETIDGENIRKMVSKLRKKIPKETIESVYAVGYKLHSLQSLY